MIKEIEYAEFLRLALIKSRYMDFDVYFKMFDTISEEEYFEYSSLKLKEVHEKYHYPKWKKMQQDFLNWYLELDSFRQRRFIQYVFNSK